MADRILVIGSTEGSKHAEFLIKYLNKKFYDAGFVQNEYRCISWQDDDNWKNGTHTWNSLYEKALDLRKNNGFVIAMFSPDDIVTIRGKKSCIGRDNVWLEYGLFAGVLGSDRVFALVPNFGSTFGRVDANGKAKYVLGKKLEFHRPSDMEGMYRIDYRFNTPYQEDDGEMKATLYEAVDKIYNKIRPQKTNSGSGVTHYQNDTTGFNAVRIV
jgi:predicted nucleotide-binding protein